jgi:hypothetical protein
MMNPSQSATRMLVRLWMIGPPSAAQDTRV